MARRQNHSRRYGDGGGALFASNSNSRSRPCFLVALIVTGALFLFLYHNGSGGFGGSKQVSKISGDFSCTVEVRRALPILKQTYGDSMHKILHVGPDTCSVASRLLEEDETEAWGIEPYDVEDADTKCKMLVRKGIVRVADIKFPLPYRPKSFSLVIVSDALDYLSPKYLNKTLPDLARVSSEGVIIFADFPGKHKSKATDVSKFGRTAKLRSSSWWVRYFSQISLEENEAAMKKFEQAATSKSFIPNCQIFHLKSFN